MKHIINKLLLSLCCLLATQFISAGPVTVLTGDYADPSIIRVNGMYYMTHSSFLYAPGFLIWESADLENWTPVTYALQQYHGDVWAPDLVYYKDKFYIYYRCSDGNFVLEADKIEGPWSKPYPLNIPEIDPGHIADDKGNRYLYMSGGHITELNPDGLSVKKTELTKVYDGWNIPEHWVIECKCLESPKLLYKDGYYHMFSAQGGTAGPATSHMVVHARSKSISGPWENSPFNPVVHTYDRNEPWWSKGHGTVFQGPTGHWWMVYHAYNRDNKTLGRNVLFEAVEWTSDGWLKVSSPAQYERYQMKEGANLSRSDNFSGNKLGLQWQFWKAYEPERITLKDNSLTLKGKGGKVEESSPLAVIAGHNRYKVSVDVEIIGDAQAGLILFYNEKQYVGTATTGKQLFAGERGKLNPIGNTNVRKVNLCILNDFNSVEFFIDEKKVHAGIEVSGYSTQTFGGFLALRPAIFCTGEGNAIFRNFRYEPLK